MFCRTRVPLPVHLLSEERGEIPIRADLGPPRGHPVPAFEKMTDGFLFVASATPELHREVLAALRMEA